MALVPNPVTISRTPFLFRFLSYSVKPISRFGNQNKIPQYPFQMSGFRSCSSCYYQPSPFSRWALFKDIGCTGTCYNLRGTDYFRVSGAPGGGIRDYGGSDGGNSGGKGEGGDDGGRSNRSLLSWYLFLLEKYPVLTKAATSAFLTLIGDLICQVMIDLVPSLELKRTLLFTLLGLVLVGPTLHFWYLYLSKLVTSSGASGAFLCLLLDQLLFSPIFIGVFLSSLLTLEGRPSEVVPKLQQEWFSTVLANWQLWIPFQFLNFRFVPQQFQVLAANVIALIWNVILSYKAHK